MLAQSPSKAQTCDIHDRKCKQLFSGCTSTIQLLVEHPSEDASNLALDREWITDVTESRLRAAVIFDTSSTSNDGISTPYLYVSVNVVGQSFSVTIEFNKWVVDPILELGLSATTWDSSVTGTHGDDPSYIVGWVSRLVDTFVAEFLGVRDKECAAQ